MNSMPSALASRGERISTGAPLILIVPVSREIAPPRIFISVDFPAPFSPIRATISPAPTLRLTPSSATTPGNRLLIPSISRIGMFVATERCGSLRLLLTQTLVELLRKLFDVGFLHCDSRHEDLLAGWNAGLVATQDFCHQLHRAIAK